MSSCFESAMHAAHLERAALLAGEVFGAAMEEPEAPPGPSAARPHATAAAIVLFLVVLLAALLRL